MYRLAAFPPSWQQELMAAVLAPGPGAVASHRAAAALHRLDGVGRQLVEISVPRSMCPAKRPGLTVHRAIRLERVDLTRVDHIPVTSVTRTLLDLGAVADADTVELALESALRTRRTSIGFLHRRLEVLGGRGRPGTATLRQVLAGRLYEAPTESLLEARFVQLCRRHGLPPGTRQHLIDGGSARVDFAWEARRVLVELEGFERHGTPADHRHDMSRQNAVVLARPGWALLRFGWADVMDHPASVADQLGGALGLARTG
ncbi:MAG: endonuclease domain-containing protein [Acidimicrobiales bacterium]